MYRVRLLQALLHLAVFAVVSAQNEPVYAHFNMAGVTGQVEFTTQTDSNTLAKLSLEVAQPWPVWEVREFPVITTHDSYNCEDSVLGSKLHDLTVFHNITSSTTNLEVQLTGISTSVGDNAIIGRSLLLRNGDTRACATIQGSETVSHAVVNGHIAGNIHVRPAGTRYAVFTDLIKTTTLSSTTATLKIYSGSVEADLPSRQREVISLADRCTNVSADSTLITQLNNVLIAGGNQNAREMQYVDVMSFDFSGGYVVIETDSDISCANFHKFETKTVTAMFSRHGVQGTITFSQDNPYTPTQVNVNLQNLQSEAGGYHVHLYPLPYQHSPQTDLCGAGVTGGHFNPFQQTTGTTQHEYEIGDLSGKYGMLTDKTSHSQTYIDLYLPLFGKHSIVGRSVVIHSKTGSRWICANIGYPGSVVVAKAEFNGDVEGTITFVQQENMPWGDTSVFVEMTDGGTTNEGTVNHNYHIHTNPVGDDYLSTSGRCSSTGGHWNPYDVSVGQSDVYKPACEVNRLACETGDLNSKYNETIDIAVSPSITKYFYTDEVALSGAYSVIGKSVTVHHQHTAAARYVCADIKQKLAAVVVTDNTWYGTSNNDTLSGYVRISSSNLPSTVSALNVSFSGLEQLAGGYHVHALPLNKLTPGDNVCGTTGGHYNPLNATSWSNDDSLDRYEIADLSNKFGFLTGKDNFQLQTSDTNLPTNGANSIVGRSVVIHDSSSRWKCTDTHWDSEAMNGVLLEATAEFDGDVQGHITLSQVVTADGESDVSVEVKLWYSDPSQPATTNHNWHVHVNTVHEQDCSSAGGHYNPFDVDVASADYSSRCGIETPRKCEVGDMSGKLGKVDIGTKDQPTRYVFNDNFLSLSGKFSVMGRSIVIHAADSGAPRVACADLLPFGSATQFVDFEIPTPPAAFKDNLATAIHTSIGADSTDNVYVSAQKAIDSNCTLVRAYFSGLNAPKLLEKFAPSALSSVYYNADICSADIRGQDVVHAYFNMSQVTGSVTFQEISSNRVKMITSINSPMLLYPEIRSFPVITTDGQSCGDSILGAIEYDAKRFLNISSGSSNQEVALEGVSMSSIIGRSLLLRNGVTEACATIQGSETVSYAVVNGHIAGNIHVRPVGTRYAVFTDLIKTTTLSSTTATLKVYMGEIYSDQPEAQKALIPVSDRCGDSRVSSTMEVAELTNVPVAGGNARSRFFGYVSPANRFDFTSGWVKIEDDMDTSCANFHIYDTKEVKAVFNRKGVHGVITFTQNNPYAPTKVKVKLQNLRGLAGGYHVHLYPLPYQFSADTDLCGAAKTGGHLNPFNGILSGENQDQLEVGDLSGKHGPLTGRADVNETYTDLYLPLFGKQSIVGRSVVIHAADGSRWVCANIGYPGPVTVAVAEFNGYVEGTITFVQQENMPWGDTSVFVEMTDSGKTNEETVNHNYHIHMNPVGDDYLSTSGRCSSTGGHWNPYDVSVGQSDVYKPACEVNRLACETGDLNSKYNTPISIAASPGSHKYFYTDDLALSGAYSVIKRSVTVHQKNKAAARYVCADIREKLTPAVTTDQKWHGPSGMGGVTGFVKMNSTGLNSAATQLTVSLQGLASKAGGYHIHIYPLNKQNPGDNVCGTTGGHYNPLAAAGWQNGDSQDKFEIGDLSNKFGMLSNLATYYNQFTDTNLPLNGVYSVVGRSVVIHEGSARWKCTNTVWDTAIMSGSLRQAHAKFEGDIEGHIKFSQVVSMDGETDVNMEVMLWYADSSKPATMNHNWHVHMYSVVNSDCSTTSGHYNPFAKTVGSEGYKADCGSEMPRRCELGDLAGKLGKLNIGSKNEPTRYVFTDNFLSLTGPFSVLGRSVVIHAENSGAPRIACADITPIGDSTQVIQYYVLTPLHTNNLKHDLGKSIKEKVGIDSDHNVYVSAGDSLGLCTAVSVHFTGERAGELKSQFKPESISEFAPVDVDKCASAAEGGATVSTLDGLTLMVTFLLVALIPQ